MMPLEKCLEKRIKFLRNKKRNLLYELEMTRKVTTLVEHAKVYGQLCEAKKWKRELGLRRWDIR